ncbi:MAG: VWA domain-containing protein [Thermoanaerobaculia bacterium]
MRSLFRRAVPLLALLLIAGTAGRAQNAPEPSVFGESVDVRVVNVEVVVTDSDGKRVPGLKPDDFRLRVDGKDVPVEYFSEIQDGRSVAAPAPEAKAEGKAEAAVQALAEGPVGTYYLVFIDDYFSIAPNRDDVLKGLKGEAARLGPQDHMAIVAYDGGRLALLSNWSNSAAELGKAFDAAMARPARGFDRATERRAFFNDEGFASQAVGDNAPLDLNAARVTLNERQRAFADTMVRQVQGVVQASVSAMRGFAAPRGRKVMLLLSGGWPFSTLGFLTGGNFMPTREIPEGDKVLLPLASTANLLGYTIYPVDVPGVQTAAADAQLGLPRDPAFGTVAEQEIEGSLRYLAQETGGKAILNTNRNIALAEASADTRSFYWLGFSPSWQRNDKAHDIKVETRRPGLKVRSRTGFLDLSRKAEVSMTVESALLFGNAPGALPMPLKLGTPVKAKKGKKMEVPVLLALPSDLMTAVPVDGKYQIQLEVRFAASDSAGNASEIPMVPITLTADKPPTPGKFVRYETKVTLWDAADHLVVAVYDPLSGKLATAQGDFKAP